MRSAEIAIIGGGVGGASLLYHLARRGCTDVVLLEKNELTSGSTWHAAGLCTQFNASLNLMELLRRSIELYASLEAETGQAVDLHRCGSLRLACSEARLDEYRHRQGTAQSLGIPFEILGPERVRELWPLLDGEGLLGAAYLPTDGYIDPSSVTRALVRGATARGATVLRHTAVTGLDRGDGVWRIETTQGPLQARVVVNAAGQWAREVGRLVGVEHPIVPLEHHYLITEPLAEVAAHPGELPVLRDVDASYYVRSEGDALLVGPFEKHTCAWGIDGIPDDFHGQLLPGDLGRLEAVLEHTARRIPAFGTAGIRTVLNGPDGYTPDGRCLMGPVPGLPDYHVLAGFSIFGIVFSGGAGGYAAEWILDGQPSDNMWELDVRRFDAAQSATAFVSARALELYGDEYAIHYPEEETPAGRPLKTGPLYDRLAERGAVYGMRFGWERPLWFARDGEPARDRYSFRRGNWHDAVGAECRAVRSAVGVLDQTSFGKYEVSGPGAAALLDRLCANHLPQRDGQIVLTPLCTPRGGIECDLTVTRLAADRFYLVSAAATELHDYAWIERHLPGDGSVRLENVTARYGVLTLAGPRSRELLQALTDSDCGREAFGFFRCRDLALGTAPVRALRVSYVGELGYELHHPVEFQRTLYDALQEAGAPLGLVDWGYRALDSMRLEKAYRLWGADLSADWTPLEAGLERFVDFDKGDFLGRDALVAQRERGVERRLACLAVDADDADCHGSEPIRAGDELVGYVAAGGYGHVVEESIALAYLPVDYATPGTTLRVQILGDRRPARVVDTPLYDPKNERLLA